MEDAPAATLRQCGLRGHDDRSSRLPLLFLPLLALSFLHERAIEAFFGVELEGAQPGQGLVEITPLALELLDALGNPLEPAPVLRHAGRIGLVQVQVFADRVERKSEPPQSLDEGEARAVLIIEDAKSGPCARARSARSPRKNGSPAMSTTPGSRPSSSSTAYRPRSPR